jgi:hypothetical protein
MLEIQVDTIDEVRTLADQYCAACDDAAGTC